jgi:hypothetical protein
MLILLFTPYFADRLIRMASFMSTSLSSATRTLLDCMALQSRPSASEAHAVKGRIRDSCNGTTANVSKRTSGDSRRTWAWKTKTDTNCS